MSLLCPHQCVAPGKLPSLNEQTENVHSCIKATPAAWMISRCPITPLTRCKYHPLGNQTVPKESRSAMLKLCPNSEIFSIHAGRRNLCGAIRSPPHQGVGVSHNHSALPSADGPGRGHYRRRNCQHFQIHGAPRALLDSGLSSLQARSAALTILPGAPVALSRGPLGFSSIAHPEDRGSRSSVAPSELHLRAEPQLKEAASRGHTQ